MSTILIIFFIITTVNYFNMKQQAGYNHVSFFNRILQNETGKTSRARGNISLLIGRDLIKKIEILSTSLPSSQFPAHQFRPANIHKLMFSQKLCHLWSMFLGQGVEPNSPSNSTRKSCHGIISLLQRKSFKNKTSEFSAPAQAKLPVAGLQKALNILVKGLKINVFFSQLAGQMIRMFRYLPLPFSNKVNTALANKCGGTSFLAKIFSAHALQRPAQTHSSSLALCKIFSRESRLLLRNREARHCLNKFHWINIHVLLLDIFFLFGTLLRHPEPYICPF